VIIGVFLRNAGLQRFTILASSRETIITQVMIVFADKEFGVVSLQ
jgi:hypothetical protein